MTKSIFFKRIFSLMLCVVCIFSGCGKMDTTVSDKEKYVVLESLDTAEEIPLQTIACPAQLFQQELVLEESVYLGEPEDYCHRSECKRNSDCWFYIEFYTQNGLDSTYCDKIYQYDSSEQETSLLYETTEANWLNELEVSEDYIYWVEYIYVDDKLSYRVMQYELAAGETTCIATRDSELVGELCLAVSDKYLTWYDDYLDGTVDLVIYDIQSQRFLSVPDKAVFKYMPYENLTPIDAGITFFSKNKEGGICINRYEPATGELFTLELQYLKSTDDMAGCFSNDRYLGWYTEYSQGIYYFYDMNTGQLYSLNAGGELNLFHVLLTDKLYVNERSTNRIYCYDMEEEKSVYQDLGEQYALHFYNLGEQRVYMETYALGSNNVMLVITDSMN